MFQYIPEIKRRFEKELNTLISKRNTAKRLPSSQRYILDELKLMFENSDNEELKNRIKNLVEIFKKDLLPAVIKRLRDIKKAKLTGDKLINSLVSLSKDYGLFIENKEKRIKEEGKGIKIVCSEGIFLGN